jgi:hypothetical protein
MDAHRRAYTWWQVIWRSACWLSLLSMEPKGLYWELEIEPMTVFSCACRRPGFADFLGIAAKLDDSRFVSVQLQPKLREWLAQFCQKPLCFLTMFKSHRARFRHQKPALIFSLDLLY